MRKSIFLSNTKNVHIICSSQRKLVIFLFSNYVRIQNIFFEKVRYVFWEIVHSFLWVGMFLILLQEIRESLMLLAVNLHIEVYPTDFKYLYFQYISNISRINISTKLFLTPIPATTVAANTTGPTWPEITEYYRNRSFKHYTRI